MLQERVSSNGTFEGLPDRLVSVVFLFGLMRSSRFRKGATSEA
jgi:hypothetical protein